MSRRRLFRIAPLLVLLAISALRLSAQPAPADRLPPHILDVTPPSARVRGLPGSMAVQPRDCRTLAQPDARRIVDVAVQEWGFFGFRIAGAAEVEDPGDPPGPGEPRTRRPRLPPDEAARVAASIAGYWAVTPQGAWIVGRQNERWNGEDGVGARWNAPWSAAFISWVMCEAGLGAPAMFTRAIAHHAYIDQAIRTRDGRTPPGAYTAYDIGEALIAPGDLLCSSRRPAYRSLADRRRQLGTGARSHCDIVTKVDAANQRIMTIGGNVRGVVSLKVLPALREERTPLRPVIVDPERPMFAHLKLRSAAIDAFALDTAPTVLRTPCGNIPDVIATAMGTSHRCTR